jgi:hypothetical protein
MGREQLLQIKLVAKLLWEEQALPVCSAVLHNGRPTSGAAAAAAAWGQHSAACAGHKHCCPNQLLQQTATLPALLAGTITIWAGRRCHTTAGEAAPPRP